VIFRLSADDRHYPHDPVGVERHVEFRVDDRAGLEKAVRCAVMVLWDATHPLEVEERLMKARSTLVAHYGSEEAVVEALMRHIPVKGED